MDNNGLVIALIIAVVFMVAFPVVFSLTKKHTQNTYVDQPRPAQPAQPQRPAIIK